MNCPRCNAPAAEETLREFGGVCPKCLLQFSEEQDAPAFPNLEIVEMIGQGGMGVVYKARQKNLDRIVALKVLSPHLSEDPEFVERFTREAKALAQLNHPNIVGIHDSGIHDRVPYLVMEYIDGTPLRGVMAGGKFTPARALEVIPQICDALQYAHANGIVHRDIKPENILIDRQGRVKIADFGLAKLSAEQSKLTQSGFVMGTPRYMAPEQFEPAGRVDHRADIYSLGVVFYEMLTGEVPMGRFKPPSAKADVDQRLDPVVLKSLEREPNDRYQSANEVKREVTGLHATKPPPRPETRRDISLGKLSGLFALGGAATLAPLVLIGWAGGGVSWAMLSPGAVLLGFAAVLGLIHLIIRLVSRPAQPAAPNVQLERTQIGGCLLALIIISVFLLALAVLFTRRSAEAPRMVPPAPTPTLPAPPQRVQVPGTRGRLTPHPFKVDDVWPAKAELPAGLEGSTSLEGEALLAKAELPARILNDLDYSRGLVFQYGRAILVGLQFKNEFSKLRWQRDEEWREELKYWHFSLSGEQSQGIVLLQHDGSPAGSAAAELLEAGLMKKLAGRFPPKQK